MVITPVLYKTLVVGVIVLFVGIGIQPAVADTQLEEKDKNYINITSEFTGLRRKHTVKMTQHELEKLDYFFDSLYEKLNNSESDKETSQIINEAVIELDKYDLLCGLSIKQAQMRFLNYDKLNKDDIINKMSDNENSNCLIVGRITNAYFINPVILLIERILRFNYNDFFWGLFFLFKLLFYSAYLANGFPICPLRIGSAIAIGSYFEWMLEWEDRPSRGWMFTMGTNGSKGWIGKFWGELDYIIMSMSTSIFIGVEGFFGLKIYNPKTDMTSLLGYGTKVGIEYY